MYLLSKLLIKLSQVAIVRRMLLELRALGSDFEVTGGFVPDKSCALLVTTCRWCVPGWS